MWSGRSTLDRRARRPPATREHRLAGAGADDDHVGSGDRLGEAIEADGHAVDPFGERRAALGGAVGDEDLGAAGRRSATATPSPIARHR